MMNRYKEISKIVITYALFGSVWILFSDAVLGWFVNDREILTHLSIFKGWLFIFVTSVLLIFLIARLSSRIERWSNALRESEERLRFLIKNSSDILVIINEDKSQRYASPGAEKISGFPIEELEGRPIASLIHPDDMKIIESAWHEAVNNPEKTVTVQYRHIHKKNEWVFCEAVAQSFLHEPSIRGVIASVRDITERKRDQEKRKILHEKLAQSQKIESMGRLAGGVAHDFNNMLGVILGLSDLALEQVEKDQQVYSALQEIQKAARRSADLTSQLLAFARKQTVAPKVLDLNRSVETMITMLKRLIGEDIILNWLPGDNIGSIKIDPSQLDQILANLCVNARDAINGTGTITIETAGVIVDEAVRLEHEYFVAGEYVLLAISDNGCGMKSEALPHLFEPFFTTKKTGDGTGLGLATIYGIIKQNNGFINVYSEPDLGSTFKVYLPRCSSEAHYLPEPAITESKVPGSETVLLVEDEPMILEMTTLMLQGLGYRVLPASTPAEAMHKAREYTGIVSLLLTDVVMPEMNGRDLAKKILSLYPDIKLVFMSGYTANVIAHHGVLDEGVNFIQKPFSKEELASKIRDVLDQETGVASSLRSLP